MRDKVQCTIDEFLQNGRLQDFEFELTAIIQKIVAAECTISCHYINEPSSFHPGPPPIIRIGIKEGKSPIKLIWNILHEYGHFLSGRSESAGPDIKREILAWDFARKEIELYPKLLSMIQDYISYREECLESYRRAGFKE